MSIAMPTVTPDFPWGHTYTADDVLRFKMGALMCPFAAAVRETFRIVFPEVQAEDFFWMYPPELDDPASPNYSYREAIRYGVTLTPDVADFYVSLGIPRPVSANPKWWSYDVVYGGNFGSVRPLIETELVKLYNADHFDAGPFSLFQPSIFNNDIWYRISYRPDDPPEGFSYGAYLRFNWAFLQFQCENLSFYFVDPTRNWTGFRPDQWIDEVRPFAEAYFPTSDADPAYPDRPVSNPREAYLTYQENFAGKGYGLPPVLGYKLPNWPGTKGWTRKREREITTTDADGEEGQRARFVAAIRTKTFTGYNLDGTPVYTPDANYKTGIGNAGLVNAPGGTASQYPAEPWVIDPKPLVRDVQLASLPETPAEQIQFDLKIMDYVGGEWVVSDDQDSRPDIITLYGRMQPGDLLGHWLLNDLRDAIDQLRVTASLTGYAVGANTDELQASEDHYKPYADSGRAYFNVDVNGGSRASYSKREFGAFPPPFGTRTAKFYYWHATGTSYDDIVWHGYEPRGEATGDKCRLVADEVPNEGDSLYGFVGLVAIVDWTASLKYRKGSSGPATCPPAWPPARVCPEPDPSSSGPSSSGPPSSDPPPSSNPPSSDPTSSTPPSSDPPPSDPSSSTPSSSVDPSSSSVSSSASSDTSSSSTPPPPSSDPSNPGSNPPSSNPPSDGGGGNPPGGGGDPSNPSTPPSSSSSSSVDTHECMPCGGTCCVSTTGRVNMNYTPHPANPQPPSYLQAAYADALSKTCPMTHVVGTEIDGGEEFPVDYWAYIGPMGTAVSSPVDSQGSYTMFKYRAVVNCNLETFLEQYSYYYYGPAPEHTDFPDKPNAVYRLGPGGINLGPDGIPVEPATVNCTRADFAVGIPDDGSQGRIKIEVAANNCCNLPGTGCVKQPTTDTSGFCDDVI